MFKRILILCGLTLFSTTLAPSLKAGREQKKSSALSTPAQLPSLTPEPEGYIFQLLDSPLDGRVVQNYAGYTTHPLASSAGIAVEVLL